ncbi:hypothetical protein FBU30_008131 [Linnemannia zychae]|nr:hypothetical protein FBU30_008131 [Linnemannia zychae]
MLRVITQSAHGARLQGRDSLAHSLHYTFSAATPASSLKTCTAIPSTSTTAITLHHHHTATAAAAPGYPSQLLKSGTLKRILQPFTVSTSTVSRGFFTAGVNAKSVVVTSGYRQFSGAVTKSIMGQQAARRWTFQELQYVRNLGYRSYHSNNALTRFTNQFTVDSSNKIVYTIVAINVMIFGIWQYAEGNAKRFRDGRLYMFMFRNFTDSLENLREGRVWTLVTSAFSHKEWYHILLNTMVLLSFGDPVWRLLGTRRFLSVYLGSAISSSLASILYYSHMEPYLRRMQHKPQRNMIHYSMGASGSIMGITTTFACVYPMSQYSLFFVITMPAAALIDGSI